jgi:hypothetical protein
MSLRARSSARRHSLRDRAVEARRSARRPRWRATALGVAALVLGLAARPSPAAATKAASDPPADRYEPAFLPELNFDSNIGLGLGVYGTLARFLPHYDPYRYKLEAQVFLSLAIDAAKHPSLPYHEHFLRGDFPGLFGDRLRLRPGVGFDKFANAGYFGLGQLAQRRLFTDQELSKSLAARRFNTYDHLSPKVDVLGEIMLHTVRRRGRAARLALLVGVGASYDGVRIYPGSKLEEDLAASASPTAHGRELRALLHGVRNHGQGDLTLGLVWDSRDHDFAPSSGTLTELSARAGYAAGSGDEMPYVRLHAETRWYSPLWRDYLVFAHRTAVDGLAGKPPFYELARIGVLQPEGGPGGNGSVRGVLLGRFHGKVKIVENVELRGQAPWFSIAGARFRIGAVAFVDAGRVWADVPAPADLDGPWAAFALGVGGGLRLRWGETFVMRADLATSPTDHTVTGSIDLNHVF